MSKFDKEAFLQEGRQDIRNAMAGLEKMAKSHSTPYRTGGVNWAYLVKDQEEIIDQLQAQLTLAEEFLDVLKAKL